MEGKLGAWHSWTGNLFETDPLLVAAAFPATLQGVVMTLVVLQGSNPYHVELVLVRSIVKEY
jgi:type IV secretory pathway VirB3-like protein